MSALNQIKEEAELFGFHKVRVEGTHSIRWEIKCAYCGKKESHGWGPTTSPALMVRNMRKAGWLVDRNKWPKCDECREKDRKKFVECHPDGPPAADTPSTAISAALQRAQALFAKKVDLQQPSIEKAVLEPPKPVEPPVTQAGPVGLDPKVSRAIYSRLDEAFDEVESDYRGDWTDAKIAAETGVAVEVVAAIRQAAYGKIRKKVDLNGVMEELEFMRLLIDDQLAKYREEIEKRIKTIEDRVLE